MMANDIENQPPQYNWTPEQKAFIQKAMRQSRSRDAVGILCVVMALMMLDLRNTNDQYVYAAFLGYCFISRVASYINTVYLPSRASNGPASESHEMRAARNLRVHSFLLTNDGEAQRLRNNYIKAMDEMHSGTRYPHARRALGWSDSFAIYLVGATFMAAVGLVTSRERNYWNALGMAFLGMFSFCCRHYRKKKAFSEDFSSAQSLRDIINADENSGDLNPFSTFSEEYVQQIKAWRPNANFQQIKAGRDSVLREIKAKREQTINDYLQHDEAGRMILEEELPLRVNLIAFSRTLLWPIVIPAEAAVSCIKRTCCPSNIVAA